LRDLPDLERLAGRLGLGQAQPRELHALRAGVDRLPAITAALAGASSPLLNRLEAGFDRLEELGATLHRRLAADPAALVGQGVIAPGWDDELDQQRRLARGGKELLSGIERDERQRTGISSLKVRYNKVFGYYIEVSRSNLERVPDDYERRQTLTGAERFVTAELKELEARILAAEERAVTRERELYQALVDELATQAQRVSATAERIAQADVLAAFADRARRRSYCRPVVEDRPGLRLVEGRHPVLEELQRDTPFVPNDCVLDPDTSQIVLLTGPNMGGKSTYLRQVALITLMAHAGSFVPATEATIGLTDRIFTRVGASDLLLRGESTFMVEMTETANILHHASPRSLVILDEVGRGTATFDGLSLAWAIVEHLHDSPEHAALVLFATHYHELTDLARTLPRLVNRSMAVKEWRGSILFLHRVTNGPADRSYGIHVAQLAGVPREVCTRAEEILTNLERHELNVTGDPVITLPPHPQAQRVQQLDLFRSPGDEAIDRLRAVSLDHLTPLAALNLLAELKGRVT
jgi:DNA mismatch repair protein MutS